MIDTSTTKRWSRHPDYYIPAHTLPQRTSPPNLRAEAAAICELSQALAEDPSAAVRYLLDCAQDLCGAGSAGLSLVHLSQTGEATIRWEAVSGVLSAHETTALPRDSSPCGLCLDIGIAIVVSRPQRMFDQLADSPPPIAEVLTIPLYDGARKPLGTLWVAHHDSQAHFDRDNVRIAEQLAAQLALALKLQEQASDHANALAVFESHQRAQQNMLTYDLYEERSLFEQAEVENRQTLRFKDALIAEVHHRAKNTLQIASNLLTMQARASSSTQVRDALLDSAARLHVLAKVHELLYASANSTQRVLMPQLLQSLGSAFRESFGRAHPHVTLDIECDRMELSAQIAVPLALLVNEAVTNAYKHAFTDESPGMIAVALHRTRENALSLRIEDTGNGFTSPKNGDEGLGLTLIRTFATQLCGTLVVTHRDAGTGTLVALTIGDH
ncbi:sensor histidine kinase [Peristeroidobacter soli]|uniref:sensor histidine kinase n=1 Tax=Peristeroidobacter soli TaxID=2497877 RepID=UPI00158EF43F|nr:sensor histidine kinase [Peristeroidobacter soli]